VEPVGGNPVAAEADITTGNGTVTIVLKNLESNPNTVAQNLSDFSATFGNNVGTTTINSSSAQEITITGTGNNQFTLGSTVAPGWTLSNPQANQIYLNDLGSAVGPAHTLIGGPGSGPAYSNAGGSIAGNSAHNPFLNQTATWVLNAPGVTSSTTLTDVTFSFGTTSGDGITLSSVPEPGSMALMGIGVGSTGLVRMMRRRRAARLTEAATV
jgi:hypothetical protein